MPSQYTSHRWLGILLAFAFHSTNVHSFNNAVRRAAPRRLHASPNDDDNGKIQDDAAAGKIETVTMDAGGLDLTDRFKHKVHALMGDYDPLPGAVNDENQTGNIIGALLQFPTEYTFTVVGKTQLEEEESAGDIYAKEVKQVLTSVLGSDAEMEVRVVPRGKKFTRVSLKVTVESASVISSIYDELGALEATVMKF